MLDGDVVRIGRDTQNDVQLLDSEASRLHAEIRIDASSDCHLVDLQSSNGTQVNGKRIRDQKLLSGDRIEIGSTLLIFTGTGQPTAIEAAHGVDIVRQSSGADASRIISSLVRPTSRTSGIRLDPVRLVDQVAEAVVPFETELSPSSDPSDSSVDSVEPVMNTITDSDRSLEVMYLTALAVGRTDDLDELLDRILRLVFDWVDADRGCIMLRDNETNQLRPPLGRRSAP